MVHWRIPILVGSFLVLCSLWAQSKQDESRPYKLINADWLDIKKNGDEYFTTLNNNVHFFYGETEFFSDHAELYDKQKIARLVGMVKVIDDTLEVKADWAEYDRNLEQLHLIGHVFYTEKHKDGTIRTFSSNELYYLRNERKVNSSGDIIIWDERENMTGRGGYIDYNIATGYGYLQIDPILNIAKQDTLEIKAQKIEFFRESKKVVATFDVRTASPSHRTESDFLIYLADEQKAVFTGNPKFYSDFGDGKAKEIYVYFKDKKIERAILNDSCQAVFASEENGKKENIIYADNMVIRFFKGKVNNCEATGNVRAEIFSTPKQDYFTNRTNSAYMSMEVDENNKVSIIKVKNNASGVYKFEGKKIKK